MTLKRDSNKTQMFRNGKRREECRDRGFARAMTLRMPNHELQMSARQRPSWRPPGPPLSLFPLIFIVSRSGCILIFQQAGFIQPLVKLQGTSRPMMFRRFIANRSSLYFAR